MKKKNKRNNYIYICQGIIPKITPNTKAASERVRQPNPMNGAQHDCTKSNKVSGSSRTNDYKRVHTLDLLCLSHTYNAHIFASSPRSG
jgi:hypothetical protein